MRNVQWLEKEEVLAIHKSMVQKTGEPDHILNDHLLESALAKPLNLAAYSTPSIYDLAASYAEGIARNHAFENGNKRTAFGAAFSFLEKNGILLESERDNELTHAVERLSQGAMTRDEFARHLQEHSRELALESTRDPFTDALNAPPTPDEKAWLEARRKRQLENDKDNGRDI